MSRTKKLVFAAMMISVGILLPLAFHAVPNGGAVFAPMHLPVLLAGFLCGPAYGLIVGAVCPLLSFIFTGIPTAAYLPNMMAELLCYGSV
ncbi:MAG: ECF transporter S component, partial [Clostridia bacterium]|nr:ECF transporter S component [Clostridia bacterium]